MGKLSRTHHEKNANEHRPIAFYPLSVLFETPSHSELMQKPGVSEMISDIVDELLEISTIEKCTFPPEFKESVIQKMVSTQEPSTFYNDFLGKRPMEVETYLGQPVKLGLDHKMKIKRLETIYALLHHANIVNQTRPVAQASPNGVDQPAPTPQAAPAARMSAPPPGRAPMNGYARGGRGPSGGMPPGMRRGPPPGPGYRGPPNGYGRGAPGAGPGQLSRRGSFDEDNLDEFSHVVLYDDIPEGDVIAAYGEGAPNGGQPNEAALREREYMLRQRESQLRHQEMAMRRGGGGRRASTQRRPEFDEDEDFFDPADPRMSRPRLPNPDNIDMMSISGRKNRKTPSQMELREGVLSSEGRAPRLGSMGGFRPSMGRNRTSARLIHDVPGLHDSIMNDPMLGYSSDRYGTVDRKHLGDESRANSIIGGRPPDFGPNGGYPMPTPNRRASQSPGNPLGPNPRNGRPSPPNDGYFGQTGSHMNGGHPQMNGGRPSPPGGMRAPAPRYPPGQGNSVQPQQVEQQAGVSKPFPPPKNPPKSLTGSASASAGSGDSANIDSEPSAHSSQSSFAPRQVMVGVP